jgi:hypothetical protein
MSGSPRGRVVWLVGGDLEQVLLSNGRVKARAAVILLEQWAGGSTYAQESGGEQNRLNHCRLGYEWYRSVMRNDRQKQARAGTIFKCVPRK